MYSAQHTTMSHIAMKKSHTVLHGEDSASSTNDQKTYFIRMWNNLFSRNYLSSMWSGNNPLSVTVVNDEILNSGLLENSSTKNKDLTYISQEEKLFHDSKQKYPKNCLDNIESMISILRMPKMTQDWHIVDELTNLYKITNDVNFLMNLRDTYKDNNTMESHSVLHVNRTEKTTKNSMTYPNPSDVDPQNWEIDIQEDIDIESFLVVSHSDVPATSVSFIRENRISRFSNVCRNAWNSLTSRLYCKPESTRMSAVKRPLYLTKHHHRRKVNAIATGRGRGRAKCQLRRSGVSQTICRKECIKSDDREAWQNNLFDIAQNNCLLDNKLDSLGSNMDTADSKLNPQVTKQIDSLAISSFSRATPTKGKPKARKKKKIKAENVTKVRYIPISSRMNDCENNSSEMPDAQKDSFRSRTLSESSDDGWIVFEGDNDELPETREKQGAIEYSTGACYVPNSSMRMNDSTCKNSKSKTHDAEQASFRLRLSSKNSDDSDDSNKSDNSDTSNNSFASEENDDIDGCDEISFHDGDSQLEDDSVVFADEDSEKLIAQTKKVLKDHRYLRHLGL